MKLKYFDRDANKTVTLHLPDAVDVVEIQIDGESRLGPYHNVNLAININTDAVVVHGNDKKIAVHSFDDMLNQAELDGVPIPLKVYLGNLLG
jgi:hypothetical protein